MAEQQPIRNFCIIAHIDHGKSTLADRFLEVTKTVEARVMHDQLLDTMDLERERGITIKLQPVRMQYALNGTSYTLNLIDTPGHVDFTYEVSRSLAACEGAILLVDATQGIQAQTLANLYIAIDLNLTVIPVINKIDLPSADVESTERAIVHLLGCDPKEILRVSGKTGQGVEALLAAVIERVPEPKAVSGDGPAALIFDSAFDEYRGVIAYVRVFDGTFKKGDRFHLMATGVTDEILEVGSFQPQLQPREALTPGSIGYVVTGLKQVSECRVGDTLGKPQQTTQALPGYKEMKSVVFAGIFCKEGDDYPALRDALEKLKLSDAAMQFEPEHSQALGYGFRCGFLGLLHLDIIQERLKREFAMDLVITTPSVGYKVIITTGETLEVRSPLDLPDPSRIQETLEPWMSLDIVTPTSYLGNILNLLNEKRAKPTAQEMEYLDEKRVILHYEVPLAALIVDFYDSLKNVSSGFASMNYELKEYRPADVVRLDILVASERVEALSTIIYRDETYGAGKKIVHALKAVLPRQQFEVRLQAAIGGKIIASEKIPPMRKDVTAKLYGGDVTRKRKLLEKQKKGKKRMKTMGKVDIPQSAFLAILKR